eukprot:PhM_4_TR11319/c0_g1_i1/m.99407
MPIPPTAPRRPPPLPPGGSYSSQHHRDVSPTQSPPRANYLSATYRATTSTRVTELSSSRQYSPERSGSQQTGGNLAIAPPASHTVASNNSDNGTDNGELAAASAVQSMLLKTRISSQQNELQKLRAEMKESNERCVNLNLELNKVKMENSSLVAKTNKLQSRKEVLEGSVRKLEELIETERSSHTSVKRLSEDFRAQLRQKDEVIASQTAMLERERQRIQRECVSGTLQALEMECRTLRDERRQDAENYSQFVNDMTVRLMDLVEDNESKLFVCRSEMMQYCTDLETRLQCVDQENVRLQSALQSFVTEVEQDTRQLVSKLMEENRGLWIQLQQDSNKMDRLREDYQRSTSKAINKDQELENRVIALTQERSAIDREMTMLRNSLEEATEALRNVEHDAQRFQEDARVFREENEVLREETEQHRRTQADFRRTIESASYSQDELQRQLEHVNTVNITLTSELQKFREQNRLLEDKLQRVGIDASGEVRKERDQALRTLENLRRQHEELVIKYNACDRELQARTEYVQTLRNNMQDTQNSVQRNLSEEFERQKQLYESALRDIRLDYDEKTEELSTLSTQYDDVRIERDRLRTHNVSLTESIEQLQVENTRLSGEVDRLNDERSRMQNSEEQTRHDAVSSEGRIRALESDVDKLNDLLQKARQSYEDEKRMHRESSNLLQSQLSDAELQRRQLNTELQQIRGKIHEDATTYRAKERLEKDKEMLIRENERLQHEYRESRTENASLMSTVGQLRDKANSNDRMREYLDSFRRRLTDFGHAKDMMEEYKRLYRQLMGELPDDGTVTPPTMVSPHNSVPRGRNSMGYHGQNMGAVSGMSSVVPTPQRSTTTALSASGLGLPSTTTYGQFRATSPLRHILADDTVEP